MKYAIYVDGEYIEAAEFNRPKQQILEWARERMIDTKTIEIYPWVGNEDG